MKAYKWSHVMSIADNLAAIIKQLHDVEIKHHRQKGSVSLLAVSKAQAIERVIAAIEAGQKRFGESYLQEALDKIKRLDNPSLEWHFIGAIQSNKTPEIAENFSWVHTVSRIKIAEQLNRFRSQNLSPLNVCIQVNISGEATKQGVALTEVLKMAEIISTLKRLTFRGLMAIPAKSDDFSEQRRAYEQMAAIQERLQSLGFPVDTLSIGMTDDLEAAIAAGSTMVRVGTAIFGERAPRA